jgi:transcriptional regulator with XRE-family HTH domain
LSNIVRMPSHRPRSFTSAERMIEEVRKDIFASGEKYKNLAEKVGVSASTINNLASGKTRWPRPTTLFPLLNALGLELKMVKKGRGE